jgi:hypothetical protein
MKKHELITTAVWLIVCISVAIYSIAQAIIAHL